MKKIIKKGIDKNKNYFPDGKKVRFICDSCRCKFDVIAPDDDVKYDVRKLRTCGSFFDVDYITVAFETHCPECNAKCKAIERK